MAKTLIGNWQPSEKTLAWCHANGYDAAKHLEFFVDYCEAGEVKYANFDAAFRNCCRGDWGNIRRNARGTNGNSGWGDARRDTYEQLTGKKGRTFDHG